MLIIRVIGAVAFILLSFVSSVSSKDIITGDAPDDWPGHAAYLNHTAIVFGSPLEAFTVPNADKITNLFFDNTLLDTYNQNSLYEAITYVKIRCDSVERAKSGLIWRVLSAKSDDKINFKINNPLLLEYLIKHKVSELDITDNSEFKTGPNKLTIHAWVPDSLHRSLSRLIRKDISPGSYRYHPDGQKHYNKMKKVPSAKNNTFPMKIDRPKDK